MTEARMGSREKPMAMSVSRGLYHSMRPRAPRKAAPTWTVFCSGLIKSRSMVFTSLERAEIYRELFSPANAWIPFSISRSKA